MTFLEAIIIAIVEGITEFLPISSTGHMILTQALLQIKSTDFIKTYIVNIQFGAILSVVVLYWRRFIQSFDFYFKLIVAFIPAAIFGFLFQDIIDELLSSVFVVAFSLVIGGIFLIWSDYWFPNSAPKTKISYKAAIIIGLFQCFALIPGISRSASTILGGLIQGVEKKTATEFSFFLAVPTMFAASLFKLYKGYTTIMIPQIQMLIIGNIVSFFVALLAIKTFLSILQKTGFRWFGIYRIFVGLIILVFILIDGGEYFDIR